MKTESEELKSQKNNEIRALLEKGKLCRDISRLGTLQLFFEQDD